MRYTVDVIGLAFGVDINTLESDDEVIQAHLDQIFPARSSAPDGAVSVLDMAQKQETRRASGRAAGGRGLHRAGAPAHAAIPALREHPTNLIEAMIAARDNPDSGLTDADVAGNVLTMLLAGEDTTANTLAWMIYLLHRHPDALRRAREEVLGKTCITTKA